MALDQVKAKAESYVKGLFEFSNMAIKSIIFENYFLKIKI